MNGYLKGVQQYNKDKTDRNVAIIQKYTREPDAELLRKVAWPFFYADDHVNVESLLQMQGWWIREGWIEKGLTPEQFVDTSFARRASRLLTTGR